MIFILLFDSQNQRSLVQTYRLRVYSLFCHHDEWCCASLLWGITIAYGYLVLLIKWNDGDYLANLDYFAKLAKYWNSIEYKYQKIIIKYDCRTENGT